MSTLELDTQVPKDRCHNGSIPLPATRLHQTKDSGFSNKGVLCQEVAWLSCASLKSLLSTYRVHPPGAQALDTFPVCDLLRCRRLPHIYGVTCGSCIPLTFVVPRWLDLQLIRSPLGSPLPSERPALGVRFSPGLCVLIYGASGAIDLSCYFCANRMVLPKVASGVT